MLGNQALSNAEYNALLFGGAVLVFAFYFNLGIYPLSLEEPRRGLIALEMMINENIWVPTQAGELYYRKPPVYNWLLIISYQLFGQASELAVRFFSVFSHLLSGVLLFFFVRRYVAKELALLTVFSFLVSVDILTYFSALGEIDLFYALTTSLSIFLIYYFGERNQNWWLFSLVYVLTALGFLTKGLTSLPFTAISLLVYFIHRRKFKQLISLQHTFGILIFASLVAGYFYQYSQYEEVIGWWTTLLSESTDKATAGGFMSFLEQFITFPLETVKILLPASLFLPLLLLKSVRNKLKAQPFVWFCLLIFVFNFPIYWFSTEAKARYIYPLVPFGVIVLSFMASSGVQIGLNRIIKVLTFSVLIVLFFAFAALPFLKTLVPVESAYLYVLVLLFLLGGLFYLLTKAICRPYVVLLLALVVLKLGISSFVPQIRRDTADSAENKRIALEVAAMTLGADIARYDDLRLSLGMVFYLEREKQRVLYSADELTNGFFFILPEALDGKEIDYNLQKKFNYRNQEIWLIKVE